MRIQATFKQGARELINGTRFLPGSIELQGKNMSTPSINDTLNNVMGSLRGNTTQEGKWLESAPKEMRGQMEAQLQMQKEQELIQQMAQLMKQVTELSKSVSRNIGA